MSVTGPGCVACDFKGTVPWSADRPHSLKPCDRCGGWSQFARTSGDEAVERLFRERGGASTATRPIVDARAETDWRPLPSCAEVLAHNARTGGGFTSSPWLCVSDPSDLHADVRVVWLAIGRDDRVMCVGGSPDPTTDPDVRVRPITRRGEALPWPEVQR